MLNYICQFVAEYFDLICISIAVILAAFSVKEYMLISAVVSVEFVLHSLTYNYVYLDARAEHGWLIYLFYAAIQLTVMSFLISLKSHFVIVMLIFINFVYNLLTIKGFFDVEFKSFFYVYPYFVGAIMIFELIYLGLLNKYVSDYRRKHGAVDLSHIDSIFYVWPKPINRLFCGAKL